MLESVLALIEAGYADHMLLSHDAGWYEPGQPDGLPKDGIRGYTALFEQFIPALKARGVDDATIQLMTVTNPARAFGIEAAGG
jgi:phosphotriesterase-related protein